MIAFTLDAALDVGSSTVKGALLDPAGFIHADAYRPIRGDLRACVSSVLRDLQRAADGAHVELVALTGSSAGGVASRLGIAETNEILAASLGAQCLAPGAGAVLEVGGEHSKFIRLTPPDADGKRSPRDFTLNSACSAGTGGFLEQEAHRLRLSIEELSERARTSETKIRIAGRCAVFAKTDIVHKHQNGLPLDDIAYALCLAMAQSVAGELVGHRPYDRPIVFVGGVASNAGMGRALRQALELEAGELLVPAAHRFADALGAILARRARGRGEGIPLDEAIDRLRRSWPAPREERGSLARLENRPRSAEVLPIRSRPLRTGTSAADSFVGIDVGSTSTNVALVAPDGAVEHLHSVATQGQTLLSARRVLEELEARTGVAECRAIGVTGSGRKLIAELIGADFDVNEITAHAAGCLHFYPETDSVFDIGGQDSKFIRIREGTVVGFEMNKVCAAGTGSFLEEMAELLGLSIVGEFAREAMRSAAPLDLGERCTVFMASEIARRLQRGHARADLAAGLSYAVVRNYLARVVGRHSVGERIVFQGGVAANEAVVAALAEVLGREVIVHRHHEAAGAIGAALLAARAATGRSRSLAIRGRELAGVSVRSFECQRCANRCDIQVAQGEGARRFFSGGLCDEYEGRAPEAASRGTGRPDLFLEREKALHRWIGPAPVEGVEPIGIPRALIFHEMLPFWGAFFSSLGLPVVLSEPTTKHTLERGARHSRRGACLPLKIAHGHVASLMKAGVRRIFLPSIASLGDRTVEERLDHLCPVEQGWPYMARALFGEAAEFLTPRLRFSIPHLLRRDILDFGRSLGATRGRTLRAFAAAREAQREFYSEMQRRGDEVLAGRDPARTYVAVLSRSYTMGDDYVRLRLGRVLDEVGMIPIPMDMLRDEPRRSDALNGMYWYFGKRALQQARARRAGADLPVLVLSTFGCGPDSFVVQMLRREMADLPVLELEVDEHSECNGVSTRLEAFRYSLEGRRAKGPPTPDQPGTVPRGTLRGRRLMIPQMSDHAFAFAAAFRSCGVDAAVLPMPDETSIARGRMALGGNECLPCACVVGDMLRCLERDEAGAPAPAFFMVSGDGPCRLGQYPWLQRAVLNEHGHADAPIFNASQDQRFYDQFGTVARTFQRTVWRGTVAVDLLFRKWREVRARAACRPEADEAHREALSELERCIERGGDLAVELRRAWDRFDRIERRGQEPAVTIAVLGENYVRCNEVANGRIAETLEELGADAWLPSLCEWVEYTNWTARLHCRYEKQWRQWARLGIVEAMQRRETANVERFVRGRLKNHGHPSLRRLFELASPYVPETFEGETIVGVGRTIDLHDRGVGGVIHVAPFGCMVGGIVETLCDRISDDLGGFPILCLQYDGRDTELTSSMIEAFVLRATAWQDERRAHEAAGRR